MAMPTSDLQLLQGIFALKLDLIDREQLFKALDTWLSERSRPLSQILLDQQALSDADLQVLEPILSSHSRSPEPSDTQVKGESASQATEKELASGGELNAISAASMGMEVSIETSIEPSSRTSAKSLTQDRGDQRSSPRFQILRAHARGGLGEVFVAKDLELNREVAVKEIQSRRASDPGNRRRFLLEAEITGCLEHPGIVPVYGLGQHPDGRPYYAMRFIKGKSLQEAIQQFHFKGNTTANSKARKSDSENSDSVDYSSLEFRKLLSAFNTVCQAIAYAHSRGVLHRDLKPSNIMLGQYGETLVVDWGLAKPLSSISPSRDTKEAAFEPSFTQAHDATHLGAALGTPAFMSPEQAAGRIDELAPASDVYSLGATLYQLLTGEAPFKGNDLVKLLKDVQEGRFRSPRSICSKIPLPLEAICLKAMAWSPQDRYAGPQNLADDLERFLADEPVSAFVEPFNLRAKRWVRRHQTWVGSTAAGLLVAISALLVLVLVVTGKNRDLEVANQQITEQSNQIKQQNFSLENVNQTLSKTILELEQSSVRERDAKTLAEENATVARQQSLLALQSLGSVVFDLQRGLRNVPGAGEVRRKLIRDAIDRLALVSDQFASRSVIDLNTMAALHDLGDILLRIGTDDVNQDEDDSSPLAAARQVYEQAFQIAQSLVNAEPNDASAQRNLAISFNYLGDVQVQSGQVAEAFQSYEQAVEIDRRRLELNPNDLQTQTDFVISLHRLGDLLFQVGKSTEALERFETALEMNQQLAIAAPDDLQIQRNLASSHEKVGDVHLESWDLVSAIQSLEDARKISQRLAKAQPDQISAQDNLAIALDKLGQVHLRNGDLATALGFCEESLSIRQAMVAAEPTDTQVQRSLAISFGYLGEVQLQIGQLEEAIRSYEGAVAIDQKLADLDPEDVKAQRGLVIALSRLSEAQLQSDRVIESLESSQKALALSELLAMTDPDDAQAQRDLSLVLTKVAQSHLQLEQPTEAIPLLERALAISQTLAASEPDEDQVQRDLSVSFDMLGDAQVLSGQLVKGIQSFEASREIRERLLVTSPDQPESHRDLVVSYYKLGFAEQDQGHFDRAITWYEKALTELTAIEQLSELLPEDETLPAEIQTEIQECREGIMALGEWSHLLLQPAEMIPGLLERRAIEMTRLGRPSEAIEAVSKLREHDLVTAEQLYNAACVYSLVAAAMKPEDGQEWTSEQIMQRDKYFELAIASLRQAIDKGWRDWEAMQQDSDLAPLFERADFKNLFPDGSNDP